MSNLSTSLLVGATALVASAAIANAQGTVYVPALSEFADGGGNTAQRVWGDNTWHYMQVFDAAYVAPSNAPTIIQSLAWRPDSGTQSIGAPTGGTFTDIVLRIGYAAPGIDSNNMDTTFANNIAPAPLAFDIYYNTNRAVAPDGPVVIPAHNTTNGQSPAPWFELMLNQEDPNTNMATGSPFVYDPTQGNLLVEIVNGTAPGTGFIGIDAAQPGGSAFNFGTSGPVSCPDQFAPYRMGTSGSSILGTSGGNHAGFAEGEGFTLYADGAPCFVLPQGTQNAPMAFFLSVQDTPAAGGSYPPIPAAVDLSPAGLPGNFDWIDFTGLATNLPQIIARVEASGLAFVPPMFFGGPRASIRLPLPGAGWFGKRIFAQAVTIDPTANSLGVVFSDASVISVGEGGGGAAHPTSQLSHTDILSPTGFWQGATGTRYGAVVKIGTL